MTTRRRFLRQGLLGGLGLGAGLTLPRVARADAGGLLLVYWVPGGWDPAYCFDPHFETGALDRDPDSAPGTAGGLSFADAPSRPSVAAFFGRHADRTVIINGLAVGSISHTQCTRLVLTGSRRPDAADLATRVASSSGAFALPHLVVSGPRFPGDLGATTVPLNPLLTGTVRGELPRGAPVDVEREALLRAYLTDAAAALPDGAPADAARQGLDRLADLEAAVDSIHLMEFATDRERLDAGVAALGQGLSRCVTVGGSLPFMSQWDSHTNNHFYQDRNFEHLFGELAQLMSRLEALPDPSGAGSLADVTTVLVMSEMGRTPVQNATGGKDHWPYTSLMVIGPGVAGGRVLGATNQALVGQPIDLGSGEPTPTGDVLTPAALGAGLLQHLGADPAAHFPDVAPFTAPFA